MDGTTLNSNKKISPKTLEGINRLLNDGVHVVVASGRCLIEMSDYKEEFKNMRYLILNNGGLIYDTFENRPLVIHRLSLEECLKAIEFAEEENAMIHLVTINDSIARPQDIKNMADFKMDIYRDMFERLCIKCEDLKSYAIEHQKELMKVNMYHRSIESRNRNAEKLKKIHLQIVFTERNNLEVAPLNITKAAGLVELSNLLNIDIVDTMAVGDALNDVEMIQAAGCGVAMGNARDEVKEVADFVTADNDHDGILVAINKFFYS